MRKAALWLLIISTLLACGTLDRISNTSESGSVAADGHAEHPFSATAASPVTISLEPKEETFDPVLEILDSGGNVLEESDFQAGGQPELLIFIPPESGNYRVRVRDFSGQAGTYTIGIVAQVPGEDGGNVTAADDGRLVPTASVPEPVEGEEIPRIPPTWTPASGSIGRNDEGVPATAIPGVFPGKETYTVQPGDTLATIAFLFGVTILDLAEANDIENIDLIEVGQILTIP